MQKRTSAFLFDRRSNWNAMTRMAVGWADASATKEAVAAFALSRLNVVVTFGMFKNLD